MASKSGGDAQRLRSEAVTKLTRALETRTQDWRDAELPALSDFAVALSLVNDLGDWSAAEKSALIQVIRAKATSDESRYLKLTQKHARLRRAIIKLGSQ